MDPDAFVQLVQELSVVSKCLNPSELADCYRLSHVFQSYGDEKIATMIQTNQHNPVLVSYISDGWSADTNSCSTAEIGSYHVFRRGKLRVEFVLQRGLLKVRENDGTIKAAFKIAEPVGMSNGKKAWHFFTAGCEFMDSPRILGALGIIVGVYVFDGALFSSLARHFTARTELFYGPCDEDADDEEQNELRATDWALPIKCVGHGCSNAVAWGLKRVLPDDGDENIHVTIESLRNGRTAIHSKIYDHLAKGAISFKPPSGTDDEIRSFWLSLRVEATMLDTLCTYDVVVENDGFVWVDERVKDHPDVFTSVASIMLYLMRWCRYSATRWAKVATSGRLFILSVIGGVDHLHKLCMEDSTTLTWHLSGFSKASFEVRRFLFVAAFSAIPAECVLIELLEDDRLLTHGERMWELAKEEVVYLVALPMFVWCRLARLLGNGTSGCELRSCVLAATHTTMAYMYDDIFQQLKQLPLSLTQGNVEANLEQLRRQDRATLRDPLSQKIWYLMDVGYPRLKLVHALLLAREAPCTSTIVEQNHAAGAMLLRDHPFLGEAALRARVVVYQSQHLVGPSQAERVMMRLGRRLERLDARMPMRRTARNQFMKELARKRAAADDGVGGKVKQQGVVRDHSALFKQLPKSKKLKLESHAAREAENKQQVLRDEMELWQTHLDILEARNVLECESGLNHSDACRFDETDVRRMCEMFTHVFGKGTVSVETLKEQRYDAPSMPSLEHQAMFLDIERRLHFPKLERPWWAKVICQFRDSFKNAAIFASNDGNTARPPVVYLLTLAKQQPFIAVFLELKLRRRALPSMHSGDCQLRQSIPLNRRTFTPLAYRDAADIPFTLDDDLFVLHDARFEEDYVVTCHRPVPFEEFVAPLGRVSDVKDSKKKEKKLRLPQDVIQRLREDFPWLRDEDLKDLCHRQRDRKPGGKISVAAEMKHGPGEANSSESDAVDEDEVKKDLSELKAMAKDASTENDGFYVRPLGGTWTKKHCHVSGNAVGGFAKGGMPKDDFCSESGWPKQMAFYFKKYGVFEAFALAREFCRRSNLFYALWASGGDAFKFTDEHCARYLPSGEFNALMDAWPAESICKEKGLAVSSLMPTLK